MQEFILMLLIIGLFAAIAPLSASKKRAATQKILADKLASLKFAVSSVLPLGEMALYTDEVHGKWFVRMNRTDTDPVIYPYSALTGFELLDSGNVIASASAGHIPEEGAFVRGRKSELANTGDCSSLLLVLRPGEDRTHKINVPLISAPVPRFSRGYRAALSEAKDAVNELMKIMASPEEERAV